MAVGKNFEWHHFAVYWPVFRFGIFEGAIGRRGTGVKLEYGSSLAWGRDFGGRLNGNLGARDQMVVGGRRRL